MDRNGNGNLLKSRDSEICVKRIRVNQGVGVVQILVLSQFDLVSLLLVLEATEPVSEPVTQMAVELINNHLISVHQKR